MAIKKIKILGAVLELPAKQHCQFSQFGPIFEVNGLDWQCFLAGSSKTAPRILIFSITIGAKPSFQLKSIAIWAPAFFMHDNSFIATVQWKFPLYSQAFLFQVHTKFNFKLLVTFFKLEQSNLHFQNWIRITIAESFYNVNYGPSINTSKVRQIISVMKTEK